MKQILESIKFIQEQKTQREIVVRMMKTHELKSLAYAANYMKNQRKWN